MKEIPALVGWWKRRIGGRDGPEASSVWLPASVRKPTLAAEVPRRCGPGWVSVPGLRVYVQGPASFPGGNGFPAVFPLGGLRLTGPQPRNQT